MDLRDQVIEATYYIRKQVGSDRFCENWEASSVSSSTRLLCKVLKLPDAKQDSMNLQRFRKSVARLAQVSHEGVERIHGVGNYRGHTYFLTEMLEAEALDVFFNQPLSRPVQETVRLAIHIARSLSYMQGLGIAHGHLHPGLIRARSNYDGIVLLKICGYYLSGYETLAGKRIAGLSPRAFGSPYGHEQEISATATEDLFSFGAVLHWLLTGRMFTQTASRSAKIPLASDLNRRVPPALDHVVASCLNPDPAVKYQTMENVVDDLMRVSIDFPHLVTPPVRSEADGSAVQSSRRRAADRGRENHRVEKPTRERGSQSASVLLTRLRSRHPHFADNEREILYFKQLFYDLYIPRGSVYLVDENLDPAISEKMRWLAYFEDFIRFSRGAILFLPGNIDLLYNLLAELVKLWLSLRRSLKRSFALSFRKTFASELQLLSSINPALDRLAGVAPAQQAGLPAKLLTDPQREALFEKLVHFTVSRLRPLVLVIHKLQHLQACSLGPLVRAQEVFSSLPVLIIGFIKRN